MTERESILRKIRLGEDSVVEFKSVQIVGSHVARPDARDLADEIGAAANSSGMTLLLGVNDKTREVEGIPCEALDEVETWVRNLCNDSIKPAVFATIRKTMIPNREGVEVCVIRVDIPKSLFVHESPHGYFYRIGSSKRKMPPEVLARLFQQRSQTRLICFDEQIVSHAEVQILKPTLYSRFRTKLSPRDDGEFLRKLHFVAADLDGVMRPTVAGILFATEHPEEFLPNAYIQAVCYRGIQRNANEQLDARDIVGPLDVQIAEACHFVMRNMRISAYKNPARVDVPQYAMNAVFEAIVNAVAHRDYSITGSKIRLQMFADHLDIFSPGGLPNSLTLDEISERQFARNELICSCLSRCSLKEDFPSVIRENIMDRRGEGVPIILSATEKLARVKPQYKLLNDSELVLTLQAAFATGDEPVNEPVNGNETVNEPVNEPVNGNETVNEPVNETVKSAEDDFAEAVFKVIQAEPGIRRPDLMKRVNASRATVARAIVALQAEHRIEFRGAPKNGGYHVIAKS